MHILTADHSVPAQIILFDPPDPVRLRFFSLTHRNDLADVYLRRQDEYSIGSKGGSRGNGEEMKEVLCLVRGSFLGLIR
jgi:hypothetical protein